MVEPLHVPDVTPVGDNERVIVYGPLTLSAVFPVLSYTPAVTENEVKLFAG